MELKIEGVGLVPDATVRVDGLTVILGENGTGKSTILKALYSVAEAPVGFSDKKDRDIRDTIDDVLSDHHVRMPNSNWNRVWRAVRDLLHTQGPGAALSELKEVLIGSGYADQNVQDILQAAQDIFEGRADDELIKILVKRNLEAEFSTMRQVRDLRFDREARITLSADGFQYGVSIGSDDECRWDGSIGNPFSSVMYYDTPYIFDIDRFCLTGGHRINLAQALVPRDIGLAAELATKTNIGRFESVMKEVIDGEFKYERYQLSYVSSEGIQLNVSNLAAGAKVFAALQLLVQSGLLNPGTLLLLDEPEVHLHPKWQNILARLIVLLARDMGVRVVMTTHSPQLLLAVQAFSMEYGQDVDHYLLERRDSGIAVRDLDGDLSGVYSEMADAFAEVDDLYWRCMDDGGERSDRGRMGSPFGRVPADGRGVGGRHRRGPGRDLRYRPGVPRRDRRRQRPQDPSQERRRAVHRR